MFPTFTLPLGFLSLLAIPGLIAIYWLRTRSRRYPVSSLMLWVNQRQAREGGLRVDRLQTPLLFFLELLTIILLALAVAAPIIRTARGAIPLMVVLDDSFSMLAGGNDTPRSRAIEALEKELTPQGFNPFTNHRYAVRYVLAGTEPQVLNEVARTAREAVTQLESWKCLSPFANLEAAIGLASEIGGAKALMLVLTDESPPQTLETDRMQWWGFGIRYPNVAFVNATRTAADSGERGLLEISNLSPRTRNTELVVEPSDATAQQSASPLHRSTLEIAPKATRRIFLNLPPDTPPLRARIDDDALAIDNEVVLLPQLRKPVRVYVSIQAPQLRAQVENALASTDRSLSTTIQPDLVFIDHNTMAPYSHAETWYMRVITEPEASAYLGPFVIDRAHPLTEGLALTGVVWGAGETEVLMGTPIVTAGNIPLLTDTERFTGGHEIRLRLRPDLSTLQNSPNWPVLIWNLLEWRASQTPGLNRNNLRLGETTTLITKQETEVVQIVSPDGTTREQPVPDRTITLKAETVGIYEVLTEADKYAFASNALYQAESDLTTKAEGRWGDWGGTTLRWWGYQSFAWCFLLLAIGVLTLHLIFMKRET